MKSHVISYMDKHIIKAYMKGMPGSGQSSMEFIELMGNMKCLFGLIYVCFYFECWNNLCFFNYYYNYLVHLFGILIIIIKISLH